jgi:hypothetical protein
MKRSQARHVAVLALAGIFLTAAALAVQEKAKAVKEDFSGNLLLWAAGAMSGRSTRLTMTIEHWTTDEERAALLKELTEGGSDALLKAMRKTTVGYVRTAQSLRYALNIASSFQTEKGRVIRLVTERPIAFGEAAISTRSMDYEFGVIEFTLNAEGKGEGVVIPTAKVSISKDGKLEVETLGTGPQKLLNVKKD